MLYPGLKTFNVIVPEFGTGFATDLVRIFLRVAPPSKWGKGIAVQLCLRWVYKRGRPGISRDGSLLYEKGCGTVQVAATQNGPFRRRVCHFSDNKNSPCMLPKHEEIINYSP